MKVLYCSCLCSEEVFRNLFEQSKNKPGQQVQKYNRTLLHGLALQKDVEVQGISKLPINRNNNHRVWIYKKRELWNGIYLNYLPCLNIPYISNIFQMLSSFWYTWKLAKKNTIVCLDVLNISMGMGVSYACKLRGSKLIGVITDLPEQLVEDKTSRFVYQCKKIIKQCQGYVLLTEAMNDFVNPQHKKPYVIIEGQVDSAMKYMNNDIRNKYKKRVCMYTGNLNRIHGIPFLVEGFIKANLEDAELHIYGEGDYVLELEKIANQYPNIKYFGVRLNDEIIQAQIKATLLINPRPTKQEFVKYSFPSKNMEYLASGTPVLTTRLPGMPAEYEPYMFFIEEETGDGLALALKGVLNRDGRELHEMGLKAKKFVMENKTEKVQAKKIVSIFQKVIA